MKKLDEKDLTLITRAQWVIKDNYDEFSMYFKIKMLSIMEAPLSKKMNLKI